MGNQEINEPNRLTLGDVRIPDSSDVSDAYRHPKLQELDSFVAGLSPKVVGAARILETFYRSDIIDRLNAKGRQPKREMPIEVDEALSDTFDVDFGGENIAQQLRSAVALDINEQRAHSSPLTGGVTTEQQGKRRSRIARPKGDRNSDKEDMGNASFAGDTEWMNRAACRTADPELFFPEVRGRGLDLASVPAKRICSDCGVRQECLVYALKTNEQHGVWGGLHEEERMRLRLPPDSKPTQ